VVKHPGKRDIWFDKTKKGYMVDKHHGFSFRFRRGASIGELDAEADKRFLSSCFIETGDFSTLRDCGSPHRIIIGRTGSGKSALISQLISSEDHVIQISPENLSLNYLSNSDILVTLERSGVKLDLFYNLLWKHVFAVELVKRKFNLFSEEKTKNWISNLLSSLKKRDQVKERALDYLAKWGNTFWQETEYRVKEVTQKLEGEINAKLGADIAALKGSIGGNLKETSEQRTEVIHRAQSVINSIQVKALSDVIQLLNDEIFTDSQQRYFIVIDRLDDNWVDDQLRYKLIRSLIETVRSFRTIENVKIVVALREDLVKTVFERTRDTGFQEEKYLSLFLNIRWDKPLLEKLIDDRLNLLVTEEYTKQGMKLADLFPKQIDKQPFLDFMVLRTQYRPRDAIAFVNECLRRSEGKGQVTVQTVRDAEIEYSAARINALRFEWAAHYSHFLDYLPILEKMNAKFSVSDIKKEKLDEFALAFCIDENGSSVDPMVRAGAAYLNNEDLHSFRVELIKALFTVGIVGIKPDSYNGQIWAYMNMSAPYDGQIRDSSDVFIHPMAWARLGVNPR
jgi:hypothetical protein